MIIFEKILAKASQKNNRKAGEKAWAKIDI